MSNLVSYDISIKLKKIGFNVPCLNYFKSDELVSDDEIIYNIRNGNDFYYNYNGYDDNEPLYDWDNKKHITTSLPTWDDVRKWLLDIYDIYIDIRRNPDKKYIVFVEDYIWLTPKKEIKKYTDYEEAKNDAFLKAIELIENRLSS